MTPSAEYPDEIVLPHDAVLLDQGEKVVLNLVAWLRYLSW